jgi:hypothetical protein
MDLTVGGNSVGFFERKVSHKLAPLSWELSERASKYNTKEQSDLLNNNIENNSVMKSLTYKIIPNTSGWLRVTK